MMTDCIMSIIADHVGPLKRNWWQGLKKKNNLGIGNVVKPTVGEILLTFVGGLWFGQG